MLLGTGTFSPKTTQAMSTKQPVDTPMRSECPRSTFIEQVDDKDLIRTSAGPEPVSHATLQHMDDPDIPGHPDPTNVQPPHPTHNPMEDDIPSDSDNDTLPYLGDPEHEFFGDSTHNISLIGAAAFKQLINTGEEVYTINIQLTSEHLDIEAL